MTIPGSLPHFERAFASAGWFIPPWISLGKISSLAGRITQQGASFSQDECEDILTDFYSPRHLATMVTAMYPTVLFVEDYLDTIAESVEAHFLGLHHIAASGIIPVIEGVGTKLCVARNIEKQSTGKMLSKLAEACKVEAIAMNFGAVGEVVSMMDSFAYFAEHLLYVNSSCYPLADRTNRHGILHGAYYDSDFGKPINFLKIIGAVDVLCFISAFTSKKFRIFVPDETPASLQLALRYLRLVSMRGSLT